MSPPSSFPYAIEAKVGEGAMGTVFRARDQDLDRLVAIKVMRREVLEGPSDKETAEARRRFLQEARAAAALAHPGITTIHAIGENETGLPYIVMEWLDGQALDVVLRKRAPLAVAEACQLAAQVAAALDAAHAAGVVHRDIKPANLILLADGRVKITDFGIARVSGSDLVRTQVGDVLATPLFASPEQLRGLSVDGRSDVFSLGVVLYAALTGRTPFAGKTLVELSTAVLFNEPTPLRKLMPDVPVALEAVVLKALHKDPAHRFPRARDLERALRAFCVEDDDDASAVASASAESSPLRRTITGLSAEPRRAVQQVVSGWPPRKVEPTSVPGLLDRLLEFPLHTEPFSGGVRIGQDALLLIHDGRILGAICLTGERTADSVVESLPKESDAVLFACPPPLSPRTVALLAALLQPRTVRHGDLDSSFVNLPALAHKLEGERFEGILALRRTTDVGYLLYEEGRLSLALFAEGWRGVNVEQPWESWVSTVSVTASVEEPHVCPVYDSYRRLLRNVTVDVATEGAAPPPTRTISGTFFGFGGKSPTAKRLSRGPESTHRLTATELTPGASTTRPGGAPRRILADEFEHDEARRLLRYLLDELPDVLAKAGKSESLKYVASWIPLVKKAILHHDLPRPKSRDTDFFDLVTMDGSGKVLHLAHRAARGTSEALREFVERVVAAKTARLATGDVGGALLVAPTFDEDVAVTYQEATKVEGEKRSWTFGAIEAATHYEGFVRMGARRGFHLLLLAEKPGGYELLLP